MANLKINYAILIAFSLFISTLINVTAAKNIDQGDDPMCLKNEKLAKITFYAYDVAGGPNSTIYEVARAAVSTDEVISFGKIYVVQVTITSTPFGVDTKVLGTVQGIITFADKNLTASEMSLNVAFTAGKYNGSTISITGHNLLMEKQRQLAVIGGTGVFRFTRGYTNINTVSSRVEDSVRYTVLKYSISATFCPLI